MKLKSFLLFFCLQLIVASAVGQIYYVNSAGGSDTNNGASWSAAFKSLDKALTEASKNSSIKQIRVSKGVYTAPSGNGFIMPPGVNVYGAFNGSDNYNPLTQAPDTLNHKTVLKGNEGRVITQLNAFTPAEKAIWSGFSVINGNADKATKFQGSGGGAYLQKNTTLRFMNLSSNVAVSGGGIYCEEGATVANCLVANNTAIKFGGGVYNKLSRVFNSLIVNNTSSMNGGGVVLNGGNVTNTTISSNKAANGGGLYNTTTAGAIQNSIIYHNSATGNAEITTTNFANIRNSIIKGMDEGKGVANKNSDPQFINCLEGNYHLNPCSPALNSGNNAHIDAYITESSFPYDIEGKQRKQGFVDMGAYEYQNDYATTPRLYVNSSKPAGGNGLSWVTAFSTLEEALAMTNNACAGSNITEIYVAKGSYYPSKTITGGTNSREKSYLITKGVKIYGGFDGNNNSETPATRNLNSNATIIHGDWSSQNLYHPIVVANNSGVETITLDGLNMIGGKADQTSTVFVNGVKITHNTGGALYVAGVGTTVILKNTKFSNNEAIAGGAVCVAEGAKVEFSEGLIEYNTATNNAGGVFVTSGANFKATSGWIANNTAAKWAGGIEAFGAGSTVEMAGTAKVKSNAAPIGNDVFMGTSTSLNLSASPQIGDAATSKGVYMTAGVSSNMTAPMTGGADVNFETPDNALLERVMVSKGSIVSDADLQFFTYIPQNYILGKRGNDIIIWKKKAVIENFADQEKTYNQLSESVGLATAVPFSLNTSIQYEYRSTGSTPAYGPTSVPPRDAGDYIVKAFIKDNADYADVEKEINFKIKKLPITIKPDKLEKEYGSSDPALFTYKITSGQLISGDTLSGKLSRLPGEDVNSYRIQQNTLANLNYEITLADEDFKVKPIEIVVRANDVISSINDPISPLAHTILSGSLLPGHALTGAMACTPILSTEGEYPISQGTLAVNDPNYTLTFIPGNYYVGKYGGIYGSMKVATIDFPSLPAMKYGDANVPLMADAVNAWMTLIGIPMKFKSSDESILKIVPTNTTPIGYELQIVGTGSVTITAFSEYYYDSNTLTTWDLGVPATQNITVAKRDLAIVPDSKVKTYGDPDPNFTFTLGGDGVVSGEVVEGVLYRTDTNPNVGLYDINKGNIKIYSNGKDVSSNYNITYSFALKQLVITKRQISIELTGGESIYGNTTGLPDYTITGLAPGDQKSDLAANIAFTSTPITQHTPVGLHPCNLIFNILAGDNYTFPTHSITSDWEVKPRPISVTAVSGSSVYGQAPVQTLAFDGLVNGHGSADMVGLNVSQPITNTSSVGNYTVGVTGTLSTTDLISKNYVLDPTNIIPGIWTVTPKVLTSITPIGGTSTYGENPSNTGFTVVGLENGEPTTILGSEISNSFGINQYTPAGTVALSIVGELATPSNYILPHAARNTANWIVNPKAITVKPGTGESTYGDPTPQNPGLTIQGAANNEIDEVVLDGLSNDFAITPTSNAIDHTLNVVGTLANTNYTLNKQTSKWTVKKKPINVTVLGGTSEYGTSPTNPGLITTDMVNGHSSAFVLAGLSNSFGINATTPVGDHTLIVNGTLTNTNYVVNETVSAIWKVTRVVAVLNWVKDATWAPVVNETTVIYDGNAKTLSATASVPTGGTIKITYYNEGQTTPLTSTPKNAGRYDVKAELIGSITHTANSIMAKLIINKADQTITFNAAQLATLNHTTSGLALVATATSGLNVTLVSSDPTIASIDPATNKITGHKGGTISITASQVGNENYNAALNVIHSVPVAGYLFKVEIDGVQHDINDVYYLDCSSVATSVNVALSTDNYSSVAAPNQSTFNVDVSKPGAYNTSVTVTTNSGVVYNYTLKIVRRFAFTDIVVQKWNNVMMLDLKRLAEHYGYKFESYRWFKNNVQIGTGSYYSAGDSQSDLLTGGAEYYAELIMNDGTVMTTCPQIVTLTATRTAAYPNPAIRGQVVTVTTDAEAQYLENATIDMYSLTGVRILRVKAEGNITKINVPSNIASGSYVIRFNGSKGYSKTFKVIVE